MLNPLIDVNVVYVNYYLFDELKTSILSLIENIQSSSYRYIITVVDNSVSESSANQLKKAELANLLKDIEEDDKIFTNYICSSTNTGFGKASNIGIRSNESKYTFIVNCDTEFFPHDGTVDRLVMFLELNPSVGCVGPKLIGFDGNLQYSCFRFNLSSILVKPLKQSNRLSSISKISSYIDTLLMVDIDHEQPQFVDWVLGASMLLRNEAINHEKCFDERYFMYMEDCDLCKTLWENNWMVAYFPLSKVKHYHARESSRKNGNIISTLVKNKLTRIHTASWSKYLVKWKLSHVEHFVLCKASHRAELKIPVTCEKKSNFQKTI